jgi:hypothetical protein
MFSKLRSGLAYANVMATIAVFLATPARRGPGALSFDGQFPIDDAYQDIALVNGVRVSIICLTSGNAIGVNVEAPDPAHSFYGWGTESIDGGVVVAERRWLQPCFPAQTRRPHGL